MASNEKKFLGYTKITGRIFSRARKKGKKDNVIHKRLHDPVSECMEEQHPVEAVNDIGRKVSILRKEERSNLQIA